MRFVLEWCGDAASMLALEACLDAGHEVALRLPPAPILVPDFLLEEQAAALGLDLTSEAPTAAPTPTPRAHADLVARGCRAVVVAVQAPLDAAFLGRVLDGEALRDAAMAGGGDAFSVFVFDGPRFRRRVDIVAGDAEPGDGGWVLPLSLRGC